MEMKIILLFHFDMMKEGQIDGSNVNSIGSEKNSWFYSSRIFFFGGFNDEHSFD